MIDPANDQLKSVVAGVLGRDPHAIPDGTLLVSTEELIRVQQLLEVAITEHVQVLDARDVTVGLCAATTKSWLVNQVHLGTAEAARYLTVGRMLPSRPDMATALREGRMNLEHARAISICLRKIDPDLRDVVEKELVKAAEEMTPADLAGFARELCDLLGGNDTAEARAERQYGDRYLRITPTYDGMHRIDGMLDNFLPSSQPNASSKGHGQPFGCNEGPQTPPRRRAAVGQRTADGLREVCEIALRAHQLPQLGGEPAQIIATLPASDLQAAVGDIIGKTGLLNGEPVTIATLRRWACDAGIIPAVLGGASEVLDLGRSTPTWSPAQRRALRIQDAGCAWPGLPGWKPCREPLSRSRIHHIDWWSRGGHTTTKRGVHLCPFHHWVVHHTNWHIDRLPDGTIKIWRT